MNKYTLHRPGIALLACLLVWTACGSDKSPTDPGKDGPPQPTSISLSNHYIGLSALGDSIRVTATVKDQNGAAITDASITWSSTDTAIAKVNASGWTFAVSNGTAKIVATSGSLADTATVVVDQVPASITLSPDSVELATGDTVRLSAVVLDWNDEAIEGTALTWTSADSAIARVDDAGLVTGVAVGGTSVIAIAGDVADTVTVSVTTGSGDGPGTGGPGDDPGPGPDPDDDEPVPTIVAITPSSISFQALGDSTLATAVVRDGDGAELDDVSVTWTSTDAAVATVSPGGWVKAIANGTSSIVARAGEVADTITVDVSQVAVTLTVSRDSVVVGEERSVQLSATVADGNGHPIVDAPITWSSESTTNATVDNTGLVTGKRRGSKTTVTAKHGSLSIDIPVRVMKQLVFVTPSGGIYRIDEDGTGEKELLASGGNYPAWSPDGSKLAYLVGSGLSYDIWVMDADGTNKKQLTNDKKSRTPVWSPDGNQIAFASDRHSAGTTAIYVMNADGTGQTKVTNSTNAESFPVWSPTGGTIAFIREFQVPGTLDTQFEIFTIKPNGTGEVRVTNNTATDFHPSWSPTGGQFVFYSDSSGRLRLYVYEASTGKTSLLSSAVPPDHDWLYPEWSPDGGRILFHRNYDGISNLVIMEYATKTNTYLSWSGIPSSRFGRWSADGSGVLFTVEGGDAAGLYFLQTESKPFGSPKLVTNKAASGLAARHSWRPPPGLNIVIPPIIVP